MSRVLEFRQSPTDDYAHAKCGAITRAGRRCSGRWATAFVITFAWDPVLGEGIEGPHLVLCHRHRWWTHEKGVRAGRRFRVVHGWLGAANKYGYGYSVFARETGPKVAKWWWDRRRVSTFGDVGRRDAA